MRLSLAVDNFELDAELFANRCDEVGPIDAARQASVAIVRARVTPRATILSRHTFKASSVRAIAASLQASSQGKPLAQADDARNRVDDAESLGGRPRDEQPTIVGPEIQRRVSPAPAIARAGQALSRNGA